MLRCECCGEKNATVGNLTRLCGNCFKALRMYPMTGSKDKATCSLHKNTLQLSHDR